MELISQVNQAINQTKLVILYCRQFKERDAYGNLESAMFDCDSVIQYIKFATYPVLRKLVISIKDLQKYARRIA